jgi:hypothetical protein
MTIRLLHRSPFGSRLYFICRLCVAWGDTWEEATTVEVATLALDTRFT